jgi:hypothetical protein
MRPPDPVQQGPLATHHLDLPQDADWPGDTTWRPAASATFLSGRRDRSYWLLVDHLMHLGWYRLGQRAGPARAWGFRRGYTLPDHAGDAALSETQERWITAVYEKTAMRRLLRELQGR